MPPRTSYLFEDLEAHFTEYFGAIVAGQLQASISQLVFLVLTVYTIFYGLSIISQKQDVRLTDMVIRLLQVLAVVMGALLLQHHLYEVVSDLGNWTQGLVSRVDGNGNDALGVDVTHEHTFLVFLDNVVSQGNVLVKDLLDRGVPVTQDASATWWAFLVLGGTVIPAGVAGGLILLAQLALRVLLLFGPLFVLGLLFRPTVGLFRAWAEQLLNSVLTCVLLIVFTRVVFDYWVSACKLAIGDLRIFNLVHVMGVSCIALVFVLASPLIALRIASGIRNVAQAIVVGLRHS